MRAFSGGRQRVEQALHHAAVAFERQLDVVPHRVALEDRWALELAADAEPGDVGLVARQQVDVAAEQRLARVGPGLAGDDIHHGGLARAIGADDGAHLALADDERQVVQRLEAVEAHRDAVEIEDAALLAHSAASMAATGAFAGIALRGRFAHQSDSVPTMPLGRNSVTQTKSAPSTSSHMSGKAAVK